MSEKDNNKKKSNSEDIERESKPSKSKTLPSGNRGRFFTARKLFGALALAAAIFVLTAVIAVALFKAGYADSYVKEQFVVAFEDMGIDFESESFRVEASPLKLVVKKARFKNRLTGEDLITVENARFDMTVLDLYEFKSERNVNVDSTEIDGFKVWIKFDKEGKSNFDGVEILPPQNAVKFQYASSKLSLKNGLVYFGDVQREISGDSKNVVFSMEPEDMDVPDAEKRYRFDLASTDSEFLYGKSKVEPVKIRAVGVGDDKGADIEELRITTPVGSSTFRGKVTSWQDFKYDLKINSTVDLAKTSEVFPVGTAVRGFGNFEGTVKGEGENYKIDGEVTSENLAASNIRLRALRINAAIDGKSSIYKGHGKAVAELLTFEDFIIDFPQLTGNIRGTGTDFKWFGELKAAAAKTTIGTLAGLFVSDADAEYRDGKLSANLRNFNARSFSSTGTEIAELQLRGTTISSVDGSTRADIPNARAGKVNVKGASLYGVNVSGAKVNNRNSQTDVDASNVQIERLEAEDTRLKNVSAENVLIKNNGNSTTASASNVRSEGVQIGDSKVGNVDAGGVNVEISGNETRVFSNDVRVAKIETNAAVLGSLNIAGVRLRVVEGTVEATSNDFEAGDVSLRESGNLQNVEVKKPVFILEPSGRYRASLDMSLGGGVLGSVKIGAARASVVADNDEIELNDLTADVMEGKIDGKATIAINENVRSEIHADFSDLDVSKILALQGGRVIPIEGETTGRADLSFYGTDLQRASGTLTADVNANAGSEDRGLIPLTGKIGVAAADGLFSIDYANLKTSKSDLDASGRFDLNGNDSNLNLIVSSSDASEIDRIFRVLNLSSSLEEQLDSYETEFAGKFAFNGRVTGNISDPFINGKAVLDSVIMRGKDLGSLASGIDVAPQGIEFRDGILREQDGGTLSFNVLAPRTGSNNITVKAKLNSIDFGSLMTALSIDSMPSSVREMTAETSGDLNLTGLPSEMKGEANLIATEGSVKGQTFDRLESQITFDGTLINIKKLDAKFGAGFLVAKGTYETNSTEFDFDASGEDVPISRVVAFFPESPGFPEIEGRLKVSGRAKGISTDSTSYTINFDGVGRGVRINDSSFGTVNFEGKTVDKVLNANLNTKYRGQNQLIKATVNFEDPDVPLQAETTFDKSRLDPYIAIVRKPEPGSIELRGTATGAVVLAGNLSKIGDDGKRVFTSEFLQGNAKFSQFDLLIDETPLNATEPIDIKFSMNEASVDSAKFAGGGTNLVVSGTKAFNDEGINNLALDGKINLRILNALSKDIFFSGLADVAMRLTGVNKNSRLNGLAKVESASASTFIGTERITFERLKGSMIFTTNQVQIQRLTGFLGGGKINATGGASLRNLALDRYRIEIQGNNITARLPKDFVTTGNADVQINGRRIDDKLESLISGTFYAKRSVYRKDIDLADLISGRRETSLSQSSSGPSVIGVPKLDLRVLGRNALRIRNNLADLDASADFRVTGDIEFPQVSGRITANSGTITFRDDRYEVQRGVLTFPPNTAGFEPLINLQAESLISGYQVFVSLNGKLTDSQTLTAALRSNPSLPQADVVSLVTTGSLANTGNGIPTYTQSGINTAAEILADEIINKPIARATDKLFGLNKFKLDPIISGVRRNPTARLTVGRQINRNLLVTYSTNLSEDQNQVLALEYRVSNRLSFVAQYEQRSLTNVTKNRNNFAFEIRLRKRF